MTSAVLSRKAFVGSLVIANLLHKEVGTPAGHAAFRQQRMNLYVEQGKGRSRRGLLTGSTSAT